MNDRFTFSYGTTRAPEPVDGTPPARTAAAATADPNTPNAAAGAVKTPRERSDWAFLGLMAFTAVLFFRPQDQIRFLEAFHLAEIAALVGLTAMVIKRLQRGQTFVRFTPELLGVAAFGGLILALAPFSVWPGGSVALFLDIFLKVILIFVLMINTLTTPKRIEQFTWLIVIATGYIALRAVADYARGFNLVENGRVQGAVGGIFRNPNDLALNMVVVLPLSIGLALTWRTLSMRLVAAGASVLMVGAIVASHSRSGTVGLVLMLLFLGASLLRRRPALVFAGAIAVLLALPLMPGSYWDRVSSITDASRDDTGSREARRVLLREGYETFIAHPFTGVGAGQFKNYAPGERVEAWRETHNVVLQVGAELGIAGLVVFMFLFGRGLWARHQVRRLLQRATGHSRRGSSQAPEEAVITPDEARRLDAHSSAIQVSLAAWFVCALFASVAYSWTFYYLLALAIAPREVLVDRLPLRRRRTASAAVVTRIQEARA